ncbi:MAG: hypothetical protein AAF626_06035 [Pseudomonadota bacterium]
MRATIPAGFCALVLTAGPGVGQSACALLEEALSAGSLPLSLSAESDAIEMALRAQDSEECAAFLDLGGLETERPPTVTAPPCKEQGSGACSGIPGTLISDS